MHIMDVQFHKYICDFLVKNLYIISPDYFSKICYNVTVDKLLQI